MPRTYPRKKVWRERTLPRTPKGSVRLACVDSTKPTWRYRTSPLSKTCQKKKRPSCSQEPTLQSNNNGCKFNSATPCKIHSLMTPWILRVVLKGKRISSTIFSDFFLLWTNCPNRKLLSLDFISRTIWNQLLTNTWHTHLPALLIHQCKPHHS